MINPNKSMTSLTAKAYSLAYERHQGQTYGTDKRPYIGHLQDVAAVLYDFGFVSEFFQCGAWLHDILEDTATLLMEIESEFGYDIAMLVHCVTGVGSNRKQRNASIYQKISEWPISAILKVADRIANVEMCARTRSKYGPMYLKERNSFEKRVYQYVPHQMLERLETAYCSIKTA
jgi:(p)ppGpp synthase/HD superfamily hydrolase